MIGGAVADFGTGSTGHGCDGRGAVTTSHRSLRGPNSGIDVSLSTTSPASFCSHSDSSFLDMRQPALPLDSVARLLTTTSSSSFACSSLSGCRNSSSSKDTLVITTTASSTSFAARCPLTTGHYTLPSPAFFDAVVPLLESGKPDDLILQPISSIISTVTSSSPASLLADQLSASPGSSNLASIGHPNSMHSGISTANGQSGVEIVPSGDDIPTYPS
ncbi:unnamed protein product [Protopolystoma xenopodis]|uniref:Uncharacterized protein n=1 Tax=Protopolystoma xenopodis TaxID=117903 RepID=A0A3S5B271_9PLAT|nr:unnamed protein product [Protopolystoma xenopodis]